MQGCNWNPWHGCHKYSAGCMHCYVYRRDERYGLDASQVYQTKDFALPVARKKDGEYRLPSGGWVWTCFTSDFLLADADAWRGEAWRMMREREDCTFFFITKRIERFHKCLPPDWGEGYDNVHICCTVENQEMADRRLPILRDAPIKHKYIASEPLLGSIDMRQYLGPWVRQLTVGGESGAEARVCRYEWVLDLREQAIAAHVPFYFKQTGTHFEKDGRLYNVRRPLQHKQARMAHIDTTPTLMPKLPAKKKTAPDGAVQMSFRDYI